MEKEKLCTFSVYVDDKGVCGRVAGGAPGAAADILNWYFQLTPIWGYTQWEFQDPKMEVLYHIRQYFAGIFPFIGLIYGRYLQFRFLKWPLIYSGVNSHRQVANHHFAGNSRIPPCFTPMLVYPRLCDQN